jgi:hypothetical protein
MQSKAMSNVSKARLRPGAGGLGRPKPRTRLLLQVSKVVGKEVAALRLEGHGS